ncbi:HIT family protein [Candidatus Woesearchaeota archaeon CG10_big_fil_rev_8_21_14_0_10_34_12]|nr:MAG: HIT family protein [Candidatus Woesearchaeota archaeon CG10_big_fil_rev_8_21_14_0_10_34_12]
MGEECIFCRIVRGEIKAQIVDEDDNFIAFLDSNPVADGHTLIVPKKHCKTILDLPDSLGNELLGFIKKVSLKLVKAGKAEGFNIIMNNFSEAGQVVMHAHMHIIPRKEGDGLKAFV